MNQPALNRVLPNSMEAEKAVLGAMLLSGDNAREVADRLPVDDFYHAAHKTVYRTMVDMLDDQAKIDALTVIQRLTDRGELSEVGGDMYVLNLCSAAPTTEASFVAHYVQIVVEKAAQRKVIDLAHRIIQTGFDTDKPGELPSMAAQQFSALETAVAESLGRKDNFPFKSMQELEREFTSFVNDVHAATLNLHGWLPNLAKKAKLTTLVPGEVMVLVGDTGTGKSAWCQELAQCVAPEPVAMFSMELPGTKMFRRFVQQDQGMTSDQVWQTYKGGNRVQWNPERLGGIYTCDHSGLTTEAIQSRIRALTKKLRKPPVLTIVDYAQLVRGRGKRYEVASNAAEHLKVIAKQEATIIVVVSQVGRPEDKSSTADPGLHDAKDSGSWENSAGLYLAISRDPLKTGDNKRLRVRVCKQTDGESGAFQDCIYDGPTLRIDEIQEKVDQDAPLFKGKKI